MKILATIEELKDFVNIQKENGKKIALVPTMGALHEGHLTLMREAKKTGSTVIASVFVNPTQFGPNEDFDAYPRTFAADCEKLSAEGVDAVFHPEPSEMYPKDFSTFVEVTAPLTKKLCGKTRPIHFRGVATVLVKLFNLTKADDAFFGQKDAQQVLVIRHFVEDLNIDCRIHMVPIVREENGLARSSRNKYLSPEEKACAPILYQSLCIAKEAYKNGEKNATVLKSLVRSKLLTEKRCDIEYVELYQLPNLEEMEEVHTAALLAIAVRIGTTRLIDNIILGDYK